jgi:hypothetical protein
MQGVIGILTELLPIYRSIGPNQGLITIKAKIRVISDCIDNIYLTSSHGLLANLNFLELSESFLFAKLVNNLCLCPVLGPVVLVLGCFQVPSGRHKWLCTQTYLCACAHGLGSEPSPAMKRHITQHPATQPLLPLSPSSPCSSTHTCVLVAEDVPCSDSSDGDHARLGGLVTSSPCPTNKPPLTFSSRLPSSLTTSIDISLTMPTTQEVSGSCQP